MSGAAGRIDRWPWAVEGAAWRAVAAIAGAGLLAWMAASFELWVVLGGLLALAAAVVLIAKPEAATLATAFLLYVNFPAILTKQHGLPPAAAGAFILLLGLPIAEALLVRRERPRTDATFGLMLAFLGVLLMSTLGAVDSGLALGRVQQYCAEGLLVYWLVVNAVRDLRTLRGTFWLLLAAGSLLSVLCLYQDLTGSYRQEFGGLAYRNFQVSDEPVEPTVVQRRQQWDRAQGPVDEPNRFAQILIVLVPLAAFLFRTAPSPSHRLLAALLGGLTLTGVGLTLSRGGLLTLALLAIAMALLRWVRGWQVTAGAVALLIVFSAVSPFFLARVRSIAEAAHVLGGDPYQRQEADGAIRGRVTEMLAALHVFRDHPVLGVGPGQFARFYFQRYAANADIKFRDIAVPRRAHNLYLEMGAELGLLGLGTFLALVAGLMRALWRARRLALARDGQAADLAAALWLSLFAYLATGVFLHLSYQQYFWFLVALASAGLHVAARHVATPGEEECGWPRSR